MKAMNKLSAVLVVLFLAACKSGPEVVPGSERVRVFEAEPKGCLYVGEVSSVQEDRTVGTLETEMDLATRVDLRNKAHALGGNILVFLKGKNTNQLPGSTAPAKGGTSAKTPDPKAAEAAKTEEGEKEKTLVFIATVFKCPSSILNQ